MVDILQFLQDLLCYGNSSCITEFNSYAANPMEGVFYLIFFPIVFLIVFIYILGTRLTGNRGLRLLLSVAFLSFIILQGWYHWFMIIGKVWYIVLILLGFLWVALGGLKGGIGGGGAAAHARIGSEASGIISQAIKAMKDKGLGVTSVQMEMLMADLATLDNTPAGAHGIDEITRRIDSTLMEIRANLPKYLMSKAKFDQLKAEYLRIAKKKGIHVNTLLITKG